jgi:hypothetical protein
VNASYATVILFEMTHLWAQVQNLPGSEVEHSSEKDRFDRMAKEFPAMAQAAKLLQCAGFDFVNGLQGFNALSGDPEANARYLAKLVAMAPRIAFPDFATTPDPATLERRPFPHLGDIEPGERVTIRRPGPGGLVTAHHGRLTSATESGHILSYACDDGHTRGWKEGDTIEREKR